MAEKFAHEHDSRGWHWIRNTETGERGENARYQGISTFFDDVNVRTYIAVTAYHGIEATANGASLRAGIVYLITPQAHVEERHDYLVEQPGYANAVVMKLITAHEAENLRRVFRATVTRIE